MLMSRRGTALPCPPPHEDLTSHLTLMLTSATIPRILVANALAQGLL